MRCHLHRNQKEMLEESQWVPGERRRSLNTSRKSEVVQNYTDKIIPQRSERNVAFSPSKQSNENMGREILIRELLWHKISLGVSFSSNLLAMLFIFLFNQRQYLMDTAVKYDSK